VWVPTDSRLASALVYYLGEGPELSDHHQGFNGRGGRGRGGGGGVLRRHVGSACCTVAWPANVVRLAARSTGWWKATSPTASSVSQMVSITTTAWTGTSVPISSWRFPPRAVSHRPGCRCGRPYAYTDLGGVLLLTPVMIQSWMMNGTLRFAPGGTRRPHRQPGHACPGMSVSLHAAVHPYILRPGVRCTSGPDEPDDLSAVFMVAGLLVSARRHRR
jgi:hypothetical protein